jgi:hypothetical protein
MPALCQKRTHAPHQRASSFDNIVGALPGNIGTSRPSAFAIDRQLEQKTFWDSKPKTSTEKNQNPAC